MDRAVVAGAGAYLGGGEQPARLMADVAHGHAARAGELVDRHAPRGRARDLAGHGGVPAILSYVVTCDIERCNIGSWPRTTPAGEVQTIDLHGHPVCFRTRGEGPPLRPDPRHHVELGLLGARAPAARRAPHGDRARPARPRRLGQAARRLLARRVRERAARPAASRSATSARRSSATRSAAASRCSSPTSSPSASSGWRSSPAAASGARSTSMLRAATLPGAEYVLPLLARTRRCSARAPRPGAGSARVGLRAEPRPRGASPSGFATLGDEDACRAFLHTARSILDLGGQRVNASDRLYLAGRRARADPLGRARPHDPRRARARRARADAATAGSRSSTTPATSRSTTSRCASSTC